MSYRITNTADQTEERRFVRVGPGADYDSLGNYMPGEGEFAPIRVPTGTLPVTAVELSSRVRWGARSGSPIGGETFIAIEERSREDDRWKLYLLQPDVLQNEETSLFGRINLRQDLFFNEGRGPVSVRLRAGHRRERDFRVSNYSTTRRADEQEVRLRSAPLPGLTTEGRLRRATSIASAEGGAVAGNEELTSWELDLESSYQLTRATGLELTTTAARHYEAVTSRRLRQFEVAPGASYAVTGRLRIEGGTLWRASSGLESGALPVSGFGVVRRGGFEWRLAFDYRVNRLIQGVIRYDGNDLHGRPIEHRGSAEFRAFF
jgi:hypothetical protein